MKNSLIAFVPAALLAVAVITYVDGVNENYSEKNQSKSIQTENTAGKNEDACCKVDEETGRYSENSIYLLNAKWKDQDGNSVELKKFAGKKVVLAMIYTSCPSACPVIVNEMQKLEAYIPKGEISSYRFVLVSIDPDRDTPQKLTQFAMERNLDKKNWTLLTGSKNEVAELAELIGFNYKKSAYGNFSHSNLITVLNSEGVIENQSEGLNRSGEKLMTMLNK